MSLAVSLTSDSRDSSYATARGLSVSNEAVGLAAPAMNRTRNHTGEKLLPNERADIPLLTRALKWVMLMGIAITYYGVLTRGYMHIDCQPCNIERCDCCLSNSSDCRDKSQCYNGPDQSFRDILVCSRPVIDTFRGGDLQRLDCLGNDEEQHARTDGCQTAYKCMIGGSIILVLCAIVGAVSGELRNCLQRSRQVKVSRIAGHLVTLGYVAALVTLPFIIKISWRIAHWRPHDVAWMAAGAFTVMGSVMSLNAVRMVRAPPPPPRLLVQQSGLLSLPR
jgi:hypothetical protein